MKVVLKVDQNNLGKIGDVVEVAPAYDVGEVTALAGATLAAEFLCLFAANPERQA